MKYGFIRAHDRRFRVSAMCRVLRVSRSGYYDWRDRPESERTRREQGLLALIRRVHREAREAYGAKKTWLELNKAGIACGKHAVARLRRRAGIEARRKRRFRVMTEYHKVDIAPHLVQRNFAAHGPDRIWVGDMTFVRTRQGWLHLAVLLDLYSRRVIGWAMGSQANQDLGLSALAMAIEQRRPAQGLIHHTDAGSPYRGRSYRDVLQNQGLRPSMNGRKSAYDNAVAESFFSNLKNELVHHCDFQTRDDARTAIFDNIELFYNRRRIHQTLGYVSPMQFEAMNGVA